MKKTVSTIISIFIVASMLVFTTLVSFQGMQSIDEAAMEQCVLINAVLNTVNTYVIQPYLHSITLIHYFSSKPGTARLQYPAARPSKRPVRSKSAPFSGKLYLLLTSIILLNRFEMLVLFVAFTALTCRDRLKKGGFCEEKQILINFQAVFLQFLSPLEKYLKVRVKQFYIEGVVMYMGDKRPVLWKNIFRSTGFFYIPSNKRGAIL